MRLQGELVDGAAGPGARVLALGRLADAEEAAVRLGDPGDAEALHDFRVSVRRLRSTLRLLGPALQGAPSPKLVRGLRRVGRRTGPAREAEVLLEWLQQLRTRLAAPYRGALDWLIDRVELRRGQAASEVLEEAWPRFRRLAPRLARRLSARPPAPTTPEPSLSTLLAITIRAQAVALRKALGEVVGGEDGPGLHQARIEAKRLRYLLEPLRSLPGADATEAVTALKGLQDLLGSWHDRFQARQALAGALVEAAADRARRGRGLESGDLRPGLLAIDQLAAHEAAEIYQQLADLYLPSRATAVLDLAYGVAAGLEGAEQEPSDRLAPAPRLLLTGLPVEAAGAVVEEVAQGWLPGEREQVGTVRSGEGERYFRTRPGPRGATLIEAVAHADFEAYWPLTEGRRLWHRSHRIAALPGWRFDEFQELRLVLAVVEQGGEATPPAWLEPLLVRDVSGERGYRDEALARRAQRRG